MAVSPLFSSAQDRNRTCTVLLPLGPQAVFSRFEHAALALNLHCMPRTRRDLRRFAV